MKLQWLAAILLLSASFVMAENRCVDASEATPSSDVSDLLHECRQELKNTSVVLAFVLLLGVFAARCYYAQTEYSDNDLTELQLSWANARREQENLWTKMNCN